MTFFEEIKKMSEGSHEKWFKRYFDKYKLEKKIRESAKQGYTGYLINVLSVKDEYLQRRLDDTKTLEMLRERLAPGFTVEFKFYYSTNIFTKEKYVSDKKIHITW